MSDIQPACAEWREHLAAWLVAQVGPDDEAALVEHLSGCDRCSAEASSLLVVAAISLGADPGGEPWRPATDAAPPADLADRIVARVATERRGRRFRRAALALMATAAAAAVLGVVVTRDDQQPLDGEVVSFVRLAQGVEAEATVAPDGGGSLVALTAEGLDPDVHLRPLADTPRWRLPRPRRGGDVPPGQRRTRRREAAERPPRRRDGPRLGHDPRGRHRDGHRPAPDGTLRAYAGTRSGTMRAILATAR